MVNFTVRSTYCNKKWISQANLFKHFLILINLWFICFFREGFPVRKLQVIKLYVRVCSDWINRSMKTLKAYNLCRILDLADMYDILINYYIWNEIFFVWCVDELWMKRLNTLVDAVVVGFWLMVRLFPHRKLRRPPRRRKKWWCWELGGQARASWGTWTILDMRFTWCRLAIISHSLLCCPALPAAPSRRAVLLNPSAISLGRWSWKTPTSSSPNFSYCFAFYEFVHFVYFRIFRSYKYMVL